MLDYKLLEAMAAVVQEGGFERAATVLHLTQSAVSQRVRLLEERAGSVLLVRATPPRLTPAGRALLRHYRQVCRLEQDLASALPLAGGEGRAELRVGVNADSLATWFLDAVRKFVEREDVLLQLSVDDQDQTHRLLADGEVAGCVSALAEPARGCRAVRLGRMDYRLLGSPAYAARWFPDGITAEAAARAPFLFYNRKDDLQNKFLRRALGAAPERLNVHYVPSPEKYAEFIAAGLACGSLPDQQSLPYVLEGKMVELSAAPESVDLYWHCWDLDSDLLQRCTEAVVRGALESLEQ
ncbi:MAG: LysR family transcriptional regulator ArgP [Desulfovibrionaceae bacterium]|jgi:LysR family transcriptional regulator (chromosome initiation inhibitor)|nr:LysR family transcriptional regulator ArgP [Desulfovibrionaceae bacterium]